MIKSSRGVIGPTFRQARPRALDVDDLAVTPHDVVLRALVEDAGELAVRGPDVDRVLLHVEHLRDLDPREAVRLDQARDDEEGVSDDVAGSDGGEVHGLAFRRSGLHLRYAHTLPEQTNNLKEIYNPIPTGLGLSPEGQNLSSCVDRGR